MPEFYNQASLRQWKRGGVFQFPILRLAELVSSIQGIFITLMNVFGSGNDATTNLVAVLWGMAVASIDLIKSLNFSHLFISPVAHQSFRNFNLIE